MENGQYYAQDFIQAYLLYQWLRQQTQMLNLGNRSQIFYFQKYLYITFVML